MRSAREAQSERGKRAAFDRRTGEVSGSGSGAGNTPGGGEDYDSDLGEEVLAKGMQGPRAGGRAGRR